MTWTFLTYNNHSLTTKSLKRKPTKENYKYYTIPIQKHNKIQLNEYKDLTYDTIYNNCMGYNIHIVKYKKEITKKKQKRLSYIYTLYFEWNFPLGFLMSNTQFFDIYIVYSLPMKSTKKILSQNYFLFPNTAPV